MADTKEPIYDIAHLAHIQMLTPKFDASARFFIDVSLPPRAQRAAGRAGVGGSFCCC